MQTIKVGQHTLNITHPDRVLFPDDGITKIELVEYYQRISSVMLPHLKDRPLNLYRVQDSIQEGYYQQEIPAQAPSWVGRIKLKKAGGTVTHVVGDNTATLIYLANLNCVTIHAWLSRVDKLKSPDQMIFDLDPPGDDFEPVRQGTFLLKNILNEIGLKSFVKTTGSRGLHVVVPLDRTEKFEKVRSFARQIASVMTSREPEKYTTEQRIEKRKNRVFVDTLRNAYGHTAVAPYSVRARPGAPVATPLGWEELSGKNLTSSFFNLHNVFKRITQTGDPWQNMRDHATSLSSHRSRLEEAQKEVNFR